MLCGLLATAESVSETAEAITQKLLFTPCNASEFQTSGALNIFNSSHLQRGERLFLSQFRENGWSGELLAIDSNSNSAMGNIMWRAGERLATLSPEQRTILSYDGKKGVALRWRALNAVQQYHLQGSDEEETAQARLAYLRGSHADEGRAGGLRPRGSRLGDIVHSRPLYVAAPALFYPDAAPFGNDSARYSQFKNAQSQRQNMLYIGANDGMLHGFNAEFGDERIAYLPHSLFNKLTPLTSPAYEHHYYVDMTPTAADAFFSLRDFGQKSWKTVLAGALGRGGRSLFLLDITDPEEFYEGNAERLVIWEFSSEDDADLGYTLSRPLIALTHANNRSRWALIVGSGYNPDNTHAKLFILFLDADSRDGWDEGSDYITISTHSGSNSELNGLSSPAAVDIDGDGVVDRVYAGDLKGNLWAFDLSSSNPEQWHVANGSRTSPSPLFTAHNAAGTLQPITTKPAVIHHPSQTDSNNQSPNLLLFFGTGRYLTETDPNNREIQTFYAVWDTGRSQLQRGQLVAQVISRQNSTTRPTRLTSNNEVRYSNESEPRRFGWYIDFVSQPGERIIADAVATREVVLFSTFTPNSENCNLGGSSWFMFVNALNGGLLNTPVADINGDQNIDFLDRVSTSGVGSRGVPPSGVEIAGGAITELSLFDGKIVLPANSEQGSPAIPRLNIDFSHYKKVGRLSWHELQPR